ncbi:MAG TPA: hypothetical protein QF710_04545 [Candidatus Nitrosopelagicus sp.]|jgi:hypothetical protein|nr:hypothetical protein [Candidatus Nitrosopelagicus sp.]
MSDSTIDDALKLLETGKGNPDRLKKIIASFQKRSLISLEDRKYIDALVSQYLAPRQRVHIKKIEPNKDQTSFPRIRKQEQSRYRIQGDNKSYKINREEVKSASSSTLKKPDENYSTNYTSNLSENEKEHSEKFTNDENEPSLEEKFVSQIENNKTEIKKTNSSKKIILLGIIGIIIIGGVAAGLSINPELSINPDSSSIETLERATCTNTEILVSSTIVPGFPDPEKDLQHYLDRYNNEPSYADWFDRNFPGQTIQEVLVKQESASSTGVPGFPDPEKDLQHYLDRYNNEPSYADWFDRNFPGQTIQEAVC